jgi:hypothetical protein
LAAQNQYRFEVTIRLEYIMLEEVRIYIEDSKGNSKVFEIKDLVLRAVVLFEEHCCKRTIF